jgi:hypothetical protein
MGVVASLVSLVLAASWWSPLAAAGWLLTGAAAVQRAVWSCVALATRISQETLDDIADG